MTTGEIIIVVLIVLHFYLQSYLKKKAENHADKQDSREISYESQKGENLATKEDIQEITDLVESIKNEVALESQRKHEFIEKRTELFLSILRYAEEIDQCGSLIIYYVFTENAEDKIDALIKRVKDITTAVGYNQNLILVSDKNLVKNEQLEDMQTVLELTEIVLKYGAEIFVYGARAMSMMSRINGYVDLYAKCNQDQRFMDIAISVRKDLEELQKEQNPQSKYYQEFIEKYKNYIRLLSKLYNLDFNLCYNYNQPTK